jgi:hypothetical protein
MGGACLKTQYAHANGVEILKSGSAVIFPGAPVGVIEQQQQQPLFAEKDMPDTLWGKQPVRFSKDKNQKMAVLAWGQTPRPTLP